MTNTNSLQVMLKPTTTGHLTPLLCDRHGEPLPGQVMIAFETAVDDIATVTVKFCAVTFSPPPGWKV